LRLDPIHGSTIAVSALAAIAVFGQALDGRLVFLEIEAADERFDRIGISRLRISVARCPSELNHSNKQKDRRDARCTKHIH